MASLEYLNRLLTVAARVVDEAAVEIRNTKFEPVHENVDNMARALAQVFEVQRRIYTVRRDLAPAHLEESSKYPEANRLLMKFMLQAAELEQEGNILGAIGEFERFVALESSPFHREIALGEIDRLRKTKGKGGILS